MGEIQKRPFQLSFNIDQLLSTLRKYSFCICLFAFVLVSRSLTSGGAYFADGPSHLKAIADGTFVIQPPGYWLFNRLAALFPNPERAILVFNWLVSACGAIVFYRIGQLAVAPYMAKLSAILYASVFFAWFSGNVHSTYASQLLFPLLTIYLMLRFRRSPSSFFAVGVGLSFAIGAGLRPSDGAFLGPLMLYFAIRYLSKHQAAICLLTATVGCLLWLIPDLIALHHFQTKSFPSQVGGVATGAILLGHFNLFTFSNALRFFLPLAIAVGPILPFAFMNHSPFRKMLWVAILPGSAFFLLVYISDAPYLNFLLGATLLLCVQGIEFKLRRAQASAVLVAAILLNVSTYLFFQPISLPGKAALVALIVNKDIGLYTHPAVVNRWMYTIQSEMNK